MKRFFYTIFLLSIILTATSVNAATSLSYVYDANGNLINGDGKYYEYNDANQLVRVKYGDANGPVIAEYFYDYTGQRIKKIENGVTTYYTGKYFEKQIDSTGSATNTSYYFANGERVAKKDALGNMSYYHSDHLGGTNVITDPNGNLVERIRYYPFGEIRDGGIENYSFTGKEKDKLTDFYYYEARYYNPEFKHFTQADSVAPNIYDSQDLNTYAYVHNNPLIFVDPNGQKLSYADKLKPIIDKLKKTDTGKRIWNAIKYYGKKKDINIKLTELKGKFGWASSDGHGYNIYLDKNMNKVEKTVTLAHEIQHVINWAANLGFDRAEQEITARVTSGYVWRELGNPKINWDLKMQLEHPYIFGYLL